MELLAVTLTPLQRRNRAAFVRRCDIPGDPALGAGERVVLRDQHGDYFAGTVVDGVGPLDEPRYLIHVGVRLPEVFAMMRLGRSRPPASEPVPEADDQHDLQTVLDLLGEAREALGGTMPSQRLPN